ncbi:MAG: hypothetical protein Q8P18_17685 [Pseudomonadota bacterium]|nr:hypothetical protein [Pseudomonadota bacterium]
MILLLVACATPSPRASDPDADDRARYVEGLASGECEPIRDAALRDDCREATAEAPADCEAVGDATVRGECWFQLAESTKDASLCPRAVPFADDCALHVLSRGFATWLPKGARPGEHEASAEARITAAGLAVDDMRPWSAFYRQVLGGTRPIDRAACDAVAAPARREACKRTGITMYQDLLNHARDRKLYPCDGGPLPALLAYAPDPELDAVRAARRDLCPSR